MEGILLSIVLMTAIAILIEHHPTAVIVNIVKLMGQKYWMRLFRCVSLIS